MPVDLPANLRRAPFRLRFEVRRVDLHGFQRIDPFGRIVDFLVYAMRRVACNTCGVTVELVPWAEGRNELTTTYRWFLAAWARPCRTAPGRRE